MVDKQVKEILDVRFIALSSKPFIIELIQESDPFAFFKGEGAQRTLKKSLLL